MSGFKLVEIYNELANYTISVIRDRTHFGAKELPELVETLIKLYQCIKEE